MKKTVWGFMRALLSGVVFVFPLTVLAEGLVPCGRTGQEMCKLCDLFKGIQNVINWLMGALAIAALTILVAAAIMYIASAGNSKTVETAKEAIKSTLFGFAIVLLAWLIINTVFFVLPIGDAKYKNWWTISCS